MEIFIMENAEVLIRALESEIDMKCAEIRRKKSEKLLTGVFIAVAAIMLTVPSLLVFFGISSLAVFVPIIFVGAVLLAASPILVSKGAENYEQI